MNSILAVFLVAALGAMSCSGQWRQDPKDLLGVLKKNNCPMHGPCYPLKPLPLPRGVRWRRSAADTALPPDTTVINSELPTDQILQEVKKQYLLTPFEEIANVIDNYQGVESSRQKRRVRAVVITVCNRRTGKCRIIVVTRRV